ncbi:prolyl oligopeptidase family protein [Ramlibacter sp.]|uniref:prolyl oligopeptidase family serine peptidase n=1 Tax=Ramlibacter sp. TaxID=1917967 RepID=UPI0035B2CD21
MILLPRRLAPYRPGLAAALGVMCLLLAACAAPGPRATATAEPSDPYLWLEEVQGERALAWVRERNAEAEALLTAQPGFAATRDQLRAVLEDRSRLARVQRVGGHVYNLWTDATHRRGLWRRALLADYAAGRPQWEPVLDLDALGRAEGESWVWKGAACLPAATEAGMDRCLLQLSRGGADARVVREFDLRTRTFVPGGFTLPEAKSQVEWIDRDTLYVITDFGPGSLTASGYPRIVKRWSRGQPLTQAETVFEAPANHVYVTATVDAAPAGPRHVFQRAPDFHTTEAFVLQAGRLVRIDKPADARLQVGGGWAALQLRRAATLGGASHPAGTLLVTPLDALVAGRPRYDTLFTPTPTSSLARSGVRFLRGHLLLERTDNVVGGLEEWRHDGRAWQRRAVAAPGAGQLMIEPLGLPALAQDAWGDAYLMTYSDFLTPESLLLGRAGTDERSVVQRRAAQFDATGMRVEQLWATSRDGTRVPYFVVWPRGAMASADNPTLLSAYGGFQVSVQPTYQSLRGNAWLARGGVYVLANIRGGGEFGPAWHQAALREKRQNAFDDFIAVAEDLIARRITSPRHLGIAGGSNGGLLVGATVTQRPDLFGAALIQVPVLDMRRYHRLLAGASWMAEYGNPDDPADWAFLSKYSPYHQVRADAKYPRILLTTSTRDDRVHPGHARKMAALLLEQGHAALSYENIEGGHGGAADATQRAHLSALEFSYLWLQLGR